GRRRDRIVVRSYSSTRYHVRTCSRRPISPPHLCRAVFPAAVGATPLGTYGQSGGGSTAGVGEPPHLGNGPAWGKAPRFGTFPSCRPLLTIGMMNRMRTFARWKRPLWRALAGSLMLAVLVAAGIYGWL